MNIDYLFDVFKENKSDTSIIWKGNKYSYKYLIKNIEKSILLIDSYRIKPGTVVALVGDFSPNSIALLLALIKKACIIVPLSGSANTDEKQLYDIAGVEFAFIINENDGITTEKFSQISNNEYYKLIREKKHPGLVPFTSGTTGEPKAAVHDFLALLEKFKIRKKG